MLATLAGVGIAFKLDRSVEQKRKQSRVIQHLKAVKGELDQNRSIAVNTLSLISKLQEADDLDADHYLPEL